MGTGGSYCRGKAARSNAKGKNAWSYASTPYYIFMVE